MNTVRLRSVPLSPCAKIFNVSVDATRKRSFKLALLNVARESACAPIVSACVPTVCEQVHPAFGT